MERFANVPTDTEVAAFIAANPKYENWKTSLVIEVMMSLESARLNPLATLRAQNEMERQFRLEERRRASP